MVAFIEFKCVHKYVRYVSALGMHDFQCWGAIVGGIWTERDIRVCENRIYESASHQRQIK